MFLKITTFVFFLALGVLLVDVGFALGFSKQVLNFLRDVSGIAAIILALAQLFTKDN